MRLILINKLAYWVYLGLGPQTGFLFCKLVEY